MLFMLVKWKPTKLTACIIDISIDSVGLVEVNQSKTKLKSLSYLPQSINIKISPKRLF